MRGQRISTVRLVLGRVAVAGRARRPTAAVLDDLSSAFFSNDPPPGRWQPDVRPSCVVSDLGQDWGLVLRRSVADLRNECWVVCDAVLEDGPTPALHGTLRATGQALLVVAVCSLLRAAATVVPLALVVNQALGNRSDGLAFAAAWSVLVWGITWSMLRSIRRTALGVVESIEQALGGPLTVTPPTR